MNFRKPILAFLIAFVFPVQASAELERKFYPIVFDTEKPGIFLLAGTIDSRTALNFERAIDAVGVPQSLILVSGGGLVQQALLVARRVHRLAIATFIPEGEICASACAYIFLAGSPRLAEGDLGLHQISSETGDLQSGQFALSDILDVLSEFDVPNELVVNMLRTPPEEIYYLSEQEKRDFGYAGTSPAEKIEGNVPASELSLESAAIDFVQTYHQVWSQDNRTAIGATRRFYGGNVLFYGKSKQLSEVVADKIEFSNRWPIRDYRFDRLGASARCIGRTCFVSGIVRFYAANPAKNSTSRGTASFEVELEYRNGRFLIVAEDGEVLSRN